MVLDLLRDELKEKQRTYLQCLVVGENMSTEREMAERLL